MTLLLGSVTTYQVTRRSQGTYSGVGISDGQWRDGPTTSFTVELSVQPLRPHELSVLQEGERTKEAFKAYGQVTPELRTVQVFGQERCDLVHINGRDYEVHGVSGYDYAPDLNHRKYILVRSELGDQA